MGTPVHIYLQYILHPRHEKEEKYNMSYISYIVTFSSQVESDVINIFFLYTPVKNMI
jgi:hypothetical protein